MNEQVALQSQPSRRAHLSDYVTGRQLIYMLLNMPEQEEFRPYIGVARDEHHDMLLVLGWDQPDFRARLVVGQTRHTAVRPNGWYPWSLLACELVSLITHDAGTFNQAVGSIGFCHCGMGDDDCDTFRPLREAAARLWPALEEYRKALLMQYYDVIPQVDMRSVPHQPLLQVPAPGAYPDATLPC